MLSTPSDLFLRGCGLLLLVFVAAACAQAQPPAPSAPSGVRTSYREMPVRLCVPVKAEVWTALQSGKTRLVLHIQNQTPAVVYSRPFHIALLGPGKAKPVPVDDLAMQPDVQTSGQPEPQHFGIDLRQHLPTAASPTLCIEVSVDQENAAEGKAEHPLRIWATLEPLGSPPAAGKP
ncbi:MAG TPA: hypothetical protein VFE33_01570 [Thermoanaerobaculia bacterium]|nr:hypothetical protein [Thermoanaerobaculia bacterium]